METIKKNDFIEIEFTGKSNNEIFDTTDREQAKKLGIGSDVKPLIICVGNGMLLKGFEDSLEEKEIGKKYSIHLSPEEAFGRRNNELMKLIPIKVFIEKNFNPVPGITVRLDDYIARILSVSGGRVTVDFNNPLAGKEIDYEFIIKRKINDDNEKINALQDFFFKQRFEFEIKEEENNKEKKETENKKTKSKKAVFKDKKVRPLIELLKQKFKNMIGIDFEVE